jgi:hypothetical protein
VHAAALAVVKASKQVKLNASSSDPALVTLSLMLPSANLNSFVLTPTKQQYPGAAHLTLWFEPSGQKTLIHARTLILESGNLSPVPLSSNGQLESGMLSAIEKNLDGAADAAVASGSNYRGKPNFWNVLFELDAPGKDVESPPTLTKDLPVPIEKAWNSALEVLTQTQLIAAADRSAGTLAFVAAHTSQIGTKYSVHRITVTFSSTDFGTRVQIGMLPVQETAEESQDELNLYAERIGTELFIKDRLAWLGNKKGLK